MPWSTYASIPGLSEHCTFLSEDNKTLEYATYVKEIIDHRLEIFSEIKVDINACDTKRKQAILKLEEKLISPQASEYNPVEWHTDF